MTDQAIAPAPEQIDLADMRRRVRAIFIGSIGNLVRSIIFPSLVVYSTMRDTKHESAMHRHE